MRIPRFPLVCFALLASTVVLAQATNTGTGPQGEVPTIRKNVNLVSVSFTVRDQQNAFVPHLSKEDFQVFENGTPQTIKYFSAESGLPLTLGLMLETSGYMQGVLPQERLLADGFLRQIIGEKDLAFVVSFDVSVELLQDLTSDHLLLRAGLDRARVNAQGRVSRLPGVGQGPLPTSHPVKTQLFDAVYLASHEVLSKQVGRKAVVILTSGVDYGSVVKARDAFEAAQRADAICYVILIGEPKLSSASHDIHVLAEQTGGRAISVSSGEKMVEAFHQIASELRSQYSLGYSPENDKRDGTFRKIEIKSKPGLKVTARKGYFAQSN
ncbi:MAG TPA: VWA domain-containing protein [Alphaproteobacteria bacterium]|nr:VWA domain-containing protein [Alphaproteobacteria bacterium]